MASGTRVVLTIRGQKHFLWRAVDQDGNVLDMRAAEPTQHKGHQEIFRKLLQGLQYVPRVIITDKLRRYGAAKREIPPDVKHRQHKGWNNRAENSHQPTRLREKKCADSNQPAHAQRFLLSPLVPSPAIFNREGIV